MARVETTVSGVNIQGIISLGGGNNVGVQRQNYGPSIAKEPLQTRQPAYSGERDHPVQRGPSSRDADSPPNPATKNNVVTHVNGINVQGILSPDAPNDVQEQHQTFVAVGHEQYQTHRPPYQPQQQNTQHAQTSQAFYNPGRHTKGVDASIPNIDDPQILSQIGQDPVEPHSKNHPSMPSGGQFPIQLFLAFLAANPHLQYGSNMGIPIPPSGNATTQPVVADPTSMMGNGPPMTLQDVSDSQMEQQTRHLQLRSHTDGVLAAKTRPSPIPTNPVTSRMTAAQPAPSYPSEEGYQ